MRRAFVLAGLAVALGLGAWGVLVSRSRGGSEPEARAASPAELVAELGGARSQAGSAQAGAPDVLADVRAGDERGAHLFERNARALAALEAGRHQEAVTLLEACVAEAPEQPVLRANLAEALARLGSARRGEGGPDALQEATRHFARARELAPERVELARVEEELLRLLESERDRWVDLSEHFELVFDGERQDLLWSSTEICAVLETAYLEFGELFGRFPVEHGRGRIRVVLYRRGEFRSVVAVGHWAAGVFDGSVRVPLEDLGRERAQLERVLRHEVAHAFVHDLGGRSVPAWLDEGLAQWLEPTDPAGRRAAQRRARERLAGKELFPLERLRSGLAAWEDASAVARAYDQALWLVAGLSERHGERLAFDLVGDLGRGASLEQAFRARAGLELAVAVEQLAAESP